MTAVKPLRDLIVLKMDPPSQPSTFLVLTEDALDKPTIGTVLSVGPGKRKPDGTLVPVAVAANSRVMIGKGSGQPIKIDNEELLIVREDDIMVVLS